MRRIAAVVLAASATASGTYGQENCTRTLSPSSVWTDAAYSESSMSYSWSGNKTPKWFAGAVGKWNACSGSPALTVGTAGERTWTVKEISKRLPGMSSTACGYTDGLGKVGPANTIYLIDVAGCPGKSKKVFLHEMGHSLGVSHDGPNCPATIMKRQLTLP